MQHHFFNAHPDAKNVEVSPEESKEQLAKLRRLAFPKARPLNTSAAL